MLGNADRSLEPQLTARFNDQANITFYKNLIEQYRGDGLIHGPVEYMIEDRSDFRSQVCGQNVAIIFDNAQDLAFFLSQRGRDIHNPHDSYDNIYNRVFNQAPNAADTFLWNEYVRGMQQADQTLINRQQDLLTAALSAPDGSESQKRLCDIYDNFRLEVAMGYRATRLPQSGHPSPQPVA